jgi:signal transduction histidine kinase
VSIQESNAQITTEPLATIKADPQQMEQLFLNLLSNSLKYRQADHAPDIRISGHTVQPDAAQPCFYQIDITDNGIGFRNDQAERIFEPFERLHGRSQHYPGTGMGLTICRKIAERHHGTITAQGSEGQGATLSVLLPMDLSADSPA